MQRTLTPVEQLQEYYNRIYQTHRSAALNKHIDALHLEILGLETFLKLNLVLLEGKIVDARMVNTAMVNTAMVNTAMVNIAIGGAQGKISRLLSEMRIALNAYENKKSDDEFSRFAEAQILRVQKESLPASSNNHQPQKPALSFLDSMYSFFCCTNPRDPESEPLVNSSKAGSFYRQ